MLRDELGFEGYIVSDCGGVQDLANVRYPANAGCIANKDGHLHNDNSSACFFKFLARGETPAGKALNTGCDIDCGGAFKTGLSRSLSSGEANQSRVNQALRRAFLSRIKLGEFDDPAKQRYRSIGPEDLNAGRHQQVALEAAQQSITLLKNANNVLPFHRAAMRTVAVVGPNANCSIMETTSHSGSGVCNQLGNYATVPPFCISPAQGLGRYANVLIAEGSGLDGDDSSGFAAAAEASSSAAATVLVLGLGVSRDYANNTGADEGESNDRLTVAVPAIQLALYEAVAKACNGKPLVVVIIAGGPLDLSPFKEDPRTSALVWAGCENLDLVTLVTLSPIRIPSPASFSAPSHLPLPALYRGCLRRTPCLSLVGPGLPHPCGTPLRPPPRHSRHRIDPGMMGGQALAEVLYGDIAPSGRLPYSLYTEASLSNVNPMRMDMRPDPAAGYPGRTHRFWTGAPAVYSFGAGLGYSDISCTWAVDRAAHSLLPLTRRQQLVDDWLAASSNRTTNKGPIVSTHALTLVNVGRSTSHSVLLFLIPPGAGTGGRPLRELVDFKKLWLEDGERMIVEFDIRAADVTLVDIDGQRQAASGTWRLEVGGAIDALET